MNRESAEAGLAAVLQEAALRHVSDGVFLVNPDGIVSYVNSAALLLTGLQVSECQGRPVRQVLQPLDPVTGMPVPLPDPAADPPNPANPPRYVVVSKARAGRQVSISAKLLDDGHGRLLGTAFIARDETWRVVAEDSMRNSNRLFNGIVENSFDAIYILRGRRYDYVNPRFCELTGYSYGELTASDFDYNVLIAPEAREFMESRFKARRNGRTIDPRYRVRVANKAGETIVVEVVTVSLGKAGDPLVLGIMRDITDQMRAESEARQSEDLMKGIFSAMEDAVFKFDVDGRFVFVNSHSMELMMPPSRFLGKRFPEVMPAPIAKQMEEAFRTVGLGKSTDFDYSLDLPGGLRSFSARFSPVMHNGRFAGAVSVVRDVTNQRRREAEQKALEEQLQRTQLFESLGMLAGGIAHDFNNLLMGILGNAEMVQEEIREPVTTKGHVAEIELSARKAADLCRQMLAYAGRGSSQKEPLDLNDLIRDVSDLLRVNMPPGSALKLNLAGELPLLEGDATQLTQILINLVQNASESLPESGGSITIHTSSAVFDRDYLKSMFIPERMEPGRFVCLEVSDTGRGIDTTQKERIFDPFYSTKGPGRGLGLAAVLGISRGHGGSVKVYSEQGAGTTFKVLLPAMDTRSGSRSDEFDFCPLQALSGSILVVDDEEIVRSVLERMLVKIGCTVRSVASGMEAVRVYRESPGAFNCVVLDIAMPGMDGPEVFDALKIIDPSVKVVIASGYSQQQAEEKLGPRRPDAVMQKPFRIDKLTAILKSIPIGWDGLQG